MIYKINKEDIFENKLNTRIITSGNLLTKLTVSLHLLLKTIFQLLLVTAKGMSLLNTPINMSMYERIQNSDKKIDEDKPKLRITSPSMNQMITNLFPSK